MGLLDFRQHKADWYVESELKLSPQIYVLSVAYTTQPAQAARARN